MLPRIITHSLLVLMSLTLLASCGSSGGSSDNSQENQAEAAEEEVLPEEETAEPEVEPVQTAVDIELRALIDAQGLTGNPELGRTIPNINDPLPQLGKLLFFSKSLGGDIDSACVTCHHPVFGGADQLSLSVGVGALNDEVLGEGREHIGGLPLVPRNAPTVFNVALYDASLFWDSRVESLGKEAGSNGASSGIRTPDTAFGVADIGAGENLVTAQARFPVTSIEEMKGEVFENGSSNDDIRGHLAARIGDYGIGANELLSNAWLFEFQQAFSSSPPAETLVTFDNIVQAIGEYERSMLFVDNPWNEYVNGNVDALSDDQKAGAILFFTSIDNGGGGCSACHSGDRFTDEQHHLIGFPQIGVGKGDGTVGSDDFGRERETGDTDDRYRFRTPSLLNVTMTAPYGHSGSYESLNDVLAHYNNPQGSVNNYFDDEEWCELDQFENMPNCENLYPNAEANTDLAINKLQQERQQNTTLFENINLNGQERQQVVAFLNALTDPCIEDRDCLEPWIPDPTTNGPDGNQLNAIDENNNLL